MARGGRREGAGRKKGTKDRKPRSSPIIIANAQEKRELREAAREYTERALKTLAAICSEGQSEAARVSAACALLDRGYGKPTQQVETGSPGEFSALSDEQLDAQIAEGIEQIVTHKGWRGMSRRVLYARRRRNCHWRRPLR
jgi:thioesterase domain-containing protein